MKNAYILCEHHFLRFLQLCRVPLNPKHFLTVSCTGQESIPWPAPRNFLLDSKAAQPWFRPVFARVLLRFEVTIMDRVRVRGWVGFTPVP